MEMLEKKVCTPEKVSENYQWTQAKFLKFKNLGVRSPIRGETGPVSRKSKIICVGLAVVNVTLSDDIDI